MSTPDLSRLDPAAPDAAKMLMPAADPVQAKQPSETGRGGVMITLGRRFLFAREGMMAVEFAAILPFLMALFVGIVDIGQTISRKRKTFLVSRAVSDIAAQNSLELTDATLTSLWAVAREVFYPYKVFRTGTIASPDALQIVLTSVVRDASNVNKVCWSDAYGSSVTARGAGTVMPLPATMLTTPGQSVIVAEVSYSYNLLVQVGPAINLSSVTYMIPRTVAQIPRKKGVAAAISC
jgi:Flp pilus assembly protein TadG